MRARLLCRKEDNLGCWKLELLKVHIAGVPLLKRHFLAFRESGVEELEICGDPWQADRLRELVRQNRVEGMTIRVVCNPSGPEQPAAGAVLEQRADTLVDPRLLHELVQLNGRRRCVMVCVDDESRNHPVEAKSPYRVGVPEEGELRPLGSGEAADAARCPVGLKISRHPVNRQTEHVHVGRYYWHRIGRAGDATPATAKVLLATMKSTDGIYARTNRRVSLRISRRLINTRVTPNAVTLVGLLLSALSGRLFAVGGYFPALVGSFVSWFSSMLDGVDGELARARFQSSSFGCWLEMTCDFAYFIFVFTGMGIGLSRIHGNNLYLLLGMGSAAGVVLTFVFAAKQRKEYGRTQSVSDYGKEFMRLTDQAKTNRVYYFVRRCKFFATRAVFPYYLVAFALLGWTDWLLIISFIGTNLAWALTAYVGLLFRPWSRRFCGVRLKVKART